MLREEEAFRQLALGIISQAVSDLFYTGETKDYKQRRESLRMKALWWLTSPDSSMDVWAEAAGLGAAVIRQKAPTLTREEVQALRKKLKDESESPRARQ